MDAFFRQPIFNSNVPRLLQKTYPENQLPLIPWNTEMLWREANDSMRYLISNYDDELSKARNIAQSILRKLSDIFSDMDSLCAQTCSRCKAPCCRVATVWFDYKDLIFLHLNGLCIAPTQPLHHDKHHCRYLGEKGCLLPRVERPWICTIYLCPAQTALLRGVSSQYYRELDLKLKTIQQQRKDLEDEFIHKICPPSS